jgi:hypothetical protein
MTTATKIPQHMQALALGNETRLKRAALKRDIRTGKTSISDVLLAEIPDYLKKMPIGELIQAVRWVGPSKSRQILARVGDGRWPLHERKEVGYLTKRQRVYLADVLGVGAGG